MKKILVSVIVALLFLNNSWGQLNIIKPGNKDVLNDSIVVYNDSSERIQSYYVINTSPITIHVGVKKELVMVTYDSLNTFCWGINCFPYTTLIAPSADIQTINPNDTNKSFISYCTPVKSEPTIIRYVFYDTTNRSDSAWITIKSKFLPAGIPLVSGKNDGVSAPSPNPARNTVNFNYQITVTAKLLIYNSFGECVKSILLNPSGNKLAMDVSNLPSGIYICKLESEGIKPAYQKLVVSH
jgi:hypothetical protein